MDARCCVVCGEGYQPSNGRQKTCGEECRRIWRLNTKRSHWENNKEKCRDRQRLRYWRKRELSPPFSYEKQCVVCGRNYIATGRGRGKQKTCSDACAKEHRRRTEAARREADPEKARVRVRRWRARNRDDVNRRERERRELRSELQREHVRELDRLRRLRNPEKTQDSWRKQEARRSAALKLVRELQSNGLEGLL